MTILTVNKSEFEKIVGKKLDKKLEEQITMMGTPVDEITSEELSVEVFPNRPDLLNLHNFARAVKQYVGKLGVESFKIHSPPKDYRVKIDRSVKDVRPHTVCMIVKGLKFDDKKIKEVIDLQEKLHNSIGRKRRKLAIGIYPLEKIKLPIKFEARAAKDITFLPLESRREMTGLQILSGHPTGREYGHLLEGFEKFPIFTDAEGKILSMPPIINSQETGRIDESTEEVFIECSGSNLYYLQKCMNIIVAAFAGMGGKIYAMEIEDSIEGKRQSIDMRPQEMGFKLDELNRMLGMGFKEKEVRIYLERMGIGMERKKSGEYIALVPAYRTDILHWIDLTEEVAIAHGYENFEAEIPEISTIAEESQESVRRRVVSNILAGLGLLELSSYHLNVKKDIKKIHYNFSDFIELEDSKTENDVLRMDLLSNVMKVFSENSDATYPQKVFEIGRIFELDKEIKTEKGVIEKDNLVVGVAGETVNFTEIQQILDYMFKMLDIEYRIENSENIAFIPGRCGKIIVKIDGKGKEIGFIGEVAPRVLKNWKVKMPVVAMELGMDWFLGKD